MGVDKSSQIVKLTYAFGKLNTKDEWINGRNQFVREFPELPTHFWEYYISLLPSFGNASNDCGFVKSTNGLERMWRSLKTFKCLPSLRGLGDLEGVMKAIEIFETTALNSKTFSSSSKKEYVWIDILRNLATNDSVGEDLSCCSIYNSKNGLIIDRLTFDVGKGETSFTAYLPTDFLVRVVKRETESETTKEESLSPGLSMGQILFQSQKNRMGVRVSCETLSFRIKFIRNVGKHLSNHTVTLNQNENLKSYLRRTAMKDANLSLLKVKKNNDPKTSRKKKKKEVESVTEDAMKLKENNFNIGSEMGEMGHFFKVDINAERREVSCNCEQFNNCGSCLHSLLFSTLEFKYFPSLENRNLKGIQWESIRQKLIDKFKNANMFQKERKEEFLYNKHQYEVFPGVDPQYNLNEV